MIKYKLTLEYDGTGYRGWQGQKDVRTVQGTLNDAGRRLLGYDPDIQGAGRTDAGVHALGQVAQSDAQAENSRQNRLYTASMTFCRQASISSAPSPFKPISMPATTRNRGSTSMLSLASERLLPSGTSGG